MGGGMVYKVNLPSPYETCNIKLVFHRPSLSQPIASNGRLERR